MPKHLLIFHNSQKNQKVYFCFVLCSFIRTFAHKLRNFMEQNRLNEVMLRNVKELSVLSEKEETMMPAGSAPLPSVEEVRRIISLAKNIIFSDYLYRRQPDEQIRRPDGPKAGDVLPEQRLIKAGCL